MSKQDSSYQKQAEDAFLTYLDAVLDNEHRPTQEQFLASQPKAVRAILVRLFEDLESISGVDSSSPNLTSEKGDEFRLIRELGRGGMGVVWEAEQVTLKRRIALKLLKPGLLVTQRALDRFSREAEVTARIKHPNVVSVFATGFSEDQPFLAEELIEGGRTLADHIDDLRNRAALPPGHFRETARLFLKVCQALETIHRARVIHRDIKPSNILLTPEGEPKIADFGLAHWEGAASLSASGELIGTPHYLSPEQASTSHSQLDQRSDIFSLGATLYETLTLNRPFGEGSREQVLRRVSNDDPVWPRRYQPGMPRDLAIICAKALEKRRERRYQSMEELTAEITRFLNDEPILAGPPRLSTQVYKWVKRHPAISTSIGLSSIALISGLTWFIITSQTRLHTAVLYGSEQIPWLVTRANEMWPSTPQMIENYSSWIQDAEALVSQSSVYRTMLRDIRSFAKPQSEVAAAVLAAKQSTLAQIRSKQMQVEYLEFRLSGEPVDVQSIQARIDPELLELQGELKDSQSLRWMAWMRVAPDRSIYGSEQAGLAFARLAVEDAPSHLRHDYLKTLAQAQLTNNLLDEARRSAAMAVESTAELEQETQEGILKWSRGFLEQVAAWNNQERISDIRREIQTLERESAVLEQQAGYIEYYRFESAERQRMHDQLVSLLSRIDEIADPETGLLDGLHPEHGLGVRVRLERAQELLRLEQQDASYRQKWASAIDQISDRDLCPQYDGLVIQPQAGLIPLGRDPRSGLWEFAHLLSGEVPRRDPENGELIYTDACGIVLVLLPGGTYLRGAQFVDPSKPNYDPEAFLWDAPVHEVSLSPYFIAKFETTEEQYSSFTGRRKIERPWQAILADHQDVETAAYAVAWVDWDESDRFARRLGLRLPTDAEWEYACRGGTTTPRWSGQSFESLTKAGACERVNRTTGKVETGPAPVNYYTPNPYGLHSMQGNLWEWCHDHATPYSGRPVTNPVGDLHGETRVVRGGSYRSSAQKTRSAQHTQDHPIRQFANYGFRVARSLDVD